MNIHHVSVPNPNFASPGIHGFLRLGEIGTVLLCVLSFTFHINPTAHLRSGISSSSSWVQPLSSLLCPYSLQPRMGLSSPLLRMQFVSPLPHSLLAFLHDSNKQDHTTHNKGNVSLKRGVGAWDQADAHGIVYSFDRNWYFSTRNPKPLIH